MEKIEHILFDNELEKLCAIYRGFVVDNIITFEVIIDTALSTYYLNPWSNIKGADEINSNLFVKYSVKQNEFLHTILEKENFNLMFKFNALGYLLKNHCKEYEDIYPDYLNMTKELIQLRNVFAHKKIDLGYSNASEQKIVLVYFTTERGKKRVDKWEMNPTEIMNFKKKCEYCLKALSKACHALLEKK